MTWRVTFDRSTAFVEGPKAEARRRLAVCGDPAPIWVGRRGAWATSTDAAQRLLDQLEDRHLATVVTDTAQSALDLSETTPANVGPSQGALW